MEKINGYLLRAANRQQERRGLLERGKRRDKTGSRWTGKMDN
jgi:hypothetical protein